MSSLHREMRTMTRITPFEVSDRVGATGLARITGALYLAFIATSVLANVLGHIGLGDAQQIYGAITTTEWSFRLGLVVAFVSAFLFLMAAWGLYVLLRPVNQDLALLFLLSTRSESPSSAQACSSW